MTAQYNKSVTFMVCKYKKKIPNFLYELTKKGYYEKGYKYTVYIVVKASILSSYISSGTSMKVHIGIYN